MISILFLQFTVTNHAGSLIFLHSNILSDLIEKNFRELGLFVMS